MPEIPDPRQRLAELMDERRIQLGLRWQDVAEAGDISLKTLHSVRTGTGGIAPLTRRGIAKGLRWTLDSVQRILDGGAPETDSAQRGAAAGDALRQILDDERLPIETRHAMIALAEAMLSRSNGKTA